MRQGQGPNFSNVLDILVAQRQMGVARMGRNVHCLDDKKAGRPKFTSVYHPLGRGVHFSLEGGQIA
jgi:hypothetical protein